jgi:hypothetical protein
MTDTNVAPQSGSPFPGAAAQPSNPAPDAGAPPPTQATNTGGGQGRPPMPMEERVINALLDFPNDGLPMSLILPVYAPKQNVKDAMDRLIQQGKVVTFNRERQGRVTPFYKLTPAATATSSGGANVSDTGAGTTPATAGEGVPAQ